MDMGLGLKLKQKKMNQMKLSEFRGLSVKQMNEVMISLRNRKTFYITRDYPLKAKFVEGIIKKIEEGR